ncbi:MAG: hypothetical protein GY913_01795 [Proteobacteria bacterium]|nr:hypothetical protein [Pseudomonadota bacterium]MCP4915633.1 hypothetical protein [Pseudomonadota bacterium]
MRRPPPLVLATAGFAALALGLVHPVLTDPAGRALGHGGADTYNHVWGFWQVADALGRGESPLWTARVGFPEGGALWFIDLFNAIWTLPVQWAGGPILAVNVAIWANLVLAGVATWALAREVTKNEVGAVFAGVAYMAAPQVLGQLHNGISETLSIGWLPLAVLALHRLHREPGRNRALWAAAALAACGLANWYYGLFAGLLYAAYGLWALWPSARGRAVRVHLPWIGLAGLALVPALLAFRGTLNAADALVQRDPDFVFRSLIGHNMVDAIAFFWPIRSPDLLIEFDEHLQAIVYIGWVLLIPAFLGMRKARVWGLAAGAAFLFALGPFLYLGGSYTTLPSGDWIPLPFLAFFEAIPIFSPISHAYRFAIPMQLALAMSAAFVIRRPVWIPVLLAEFLLVSPAGWPTATSSGDVPAVYAQVGDGAVIDLPLSLQVLDRSRYDLYQTAHGHSIPYGLNDPTPAWLDGNPLMRTVIELERTSIDSTAAGLPVFDLVLGRERLRAAGVSAIVVHEAAYPPDMLPRVRELLTLIVGEPVEVDGALLFSLEA